MRCQRGCSADAKENKCRIGQSEGSDSGPVKERCREGLNETRWKEKGR